MFDFPESIRLHVGTYVQQFIHWLHTSWGPLFDGISSFILYILVHIQEFLQWLPWWAVILIVFLLGWWLRTFWMGIMFAVMLFLVGSFGLWDHMMLTVAIVVTAVVIALVVGIPIGILMAYGKTFRMIMTPILDVMQTMPSFVYLIPAIILFTLGSVPAILATLIYCAPPVIRLTDLAIREVSQEMVEAAQSFGSSRWQLLTKVQLPQALPTIMTGANQTTMMALAMVVISSMVGAKGLGHDVLEAINQLNIAAGFQAGISIVFLAIIIDRLTVGVANRLTTKK